MTITTDDVGTKLQSTPRATTPAVALPLQLPTGRQHLIGYGSQRAIVVERGGGLREFVVDGYPLVDGYSQRVRCPGSRGLPLLPWPERFGRDQPTTNEPHVTPGSEPGRRNALHGFCGVVHAWAPRHVGTDEVTLGVVLSPELGYSFTVDVTITYRLDAAGLSVRTDATNTGDHSCQWGSGQHPFLTTGIQRIDQLRLQLQAHSVLLTDKWGLPTGTAEIAGTQIDLNDGREIGRQTLDLTFTDLTRDPDGLAWIALTGPDHRRVSIWLNQNYRFVELNTAHTQPPPHFRTGLGIQPMTCPASALRTGHGLMSLEPGETTSAAWGVSSC